MLVYSVLNPELEQYFGFTPREVEDSLHLFNMSERFDEVKQWYDGYRFGNAEIYNPWSISKFLKVKNEEMEPHWGNGAPIISERNVSTSNGVIS